ncbi:AaceriAAL048Wp [[Ashbya] aceris (nom. inval.)]|nr:AaceriAAL048Wp [[Ashbya] aceris (nom. inval.)]
MGQRLVGDDDLIRLLKKLSEYDVLLDRLQGQMTDGFYNLSRANYHNKDSLRGSYGSDYWDQTFAGTQFVRIERDRVILEETEAKAGNDETQAAEGGLHKRVKDVSEKEAAKPQTRNPLYMFGGALSVPSSLRMSQEHFQRCMPVVLQLVNCRRELSALLDGLERDAAAGTCGDDMSQTI